MSQVNASSLLSLLDRAVPGFRNYAESDSNLFERDSVHGLFAACSHLVKEPREQPAGWDAIAELINEVVGAADANLDKAACTCFLENLANPDHPLDQLLQGEALAYWRQSCDGV